MKYVIWVSFDSKLSFYIYVKNITNKALSRLSFIERIYKDFHDVLSCSQIAILYLSTLSTRIRKFIMVK